MRASGGLVRRLWDNDVFISGVQLTIWGELKKDGKPSDDPEISYK